jgi:hypothetical protein
MNIAHYLSANWGSEFDDHSIVGYDPRSDQIEYTLSIPKSKKSLLRKFVRFGADDPNGYDSYKLSYSKVSELVRLLGRNKPPEGLQYFIEYHVPQEQKIR